MALKKTNFIEKEDF